MTTTFDINRLKSIKFAKTRTIYPHRGDVMHRFQNEAARAIAGVGTHSPRFNREGWMESFVAMRISEMPKRSNEKKMEREVNRLTNDLGNRDNRFYGIELMETSRNIYHNYSQESIDISWAEFWEMREDLAHVA